MPDEIDKSRIYLLAKKLENNTISEEEREEFNKWYHSFDQKENDEEMEEERKRQLFNRINKIKKTSHGGIRGISKSWIAIGAAASLLIVLTFGFYKIRLTETSISFPQTSVLKNDALPGEDRAVLTLSTGQKIDLATVSRGLIATQGEMQVFKEGTDLIRYKFSAGPNHSIREAYNQVTIPKGGQFQVILPDGSHVWLNASSSLRFPLLFTDRERRIQMAGEAYFEVIKDATRPFRVNTRDHMVEVLGTHFNINSYADEPLSRTTLLEGSVRVSPQHSGKAEVLRPGQQAEVAASNINVKNVDTASAIAWKQGYIQFDHTNVKELMRQISRWYDVDVVYTGTISNSFYKGRISRNSNLSAVLKMLEYSGVNTKIEGRTVVVMP